jgi:isopentenyl phosphate kinase
LSSRRIHQKNNFINLSEASCLVSMVRELAAPTILKLGGSVITHKDKAPPEIDSETISRIAGELKDHTDELIIVIGGGAHGHQAAQQYGFDRSETSSKRLLEGVPHIRHNMSILSLSVEQIFRKEGLPVVVVSPFSNVLLEDGLFPRFPLNIIQFALKSDIVVVTHGDVCFDTVRGASILSGDTITVALAKGLKARRLLIGTNVDGVLDGPPHLEKSSLIPLLNASNRERVLQLVGPSNATDVTGGMKRKISDLLSVASLVPEIVIFNLTVPGRLSALLQGIDIPCTRIEP